MYALIKGDTFITKLMSLWHSRASGKTRVRPHRFQWIQPIRRIRFHYSHWTRSKSRRGAHFSQTWTKKVFDTSVGAKPSQKLTAKLHSRCHAVTTHLDELCSCSSSTQSGFLFIERNGNWNLEFFTGQLTNDLHLILSRTDVCCIQTILNTLIYWK